MTSGAGKLRIGVNVSAKPDSGAGETDRWRPPPSEGGAGTFHVIRENGSGRSEGGHTVAMHFAAMTLSEFPQQSGRNFMGELAAP